MCVCLTFFLFQYLKICGNINVYNFIEVHPATLVLYTWYYHICDEQRKMWMESYVPFNKILVEKLFFFFVLTFNKVIIENKKTCNISQLDKRFGDITTGKIFKSLFVKLNFFRLWKIKSVVGL